MVVLCYPKCTTCQKAIKRPLVVGNGFVLTGFKEAEWEEKCK